MHDDVQPPAGESKVSRSKVRGISWTPLALVTLTATGLTGCCGTPAYLEPHGYSTTYREHVDRYDAEFAASIQSMIVIDGDPSMMSGETVLCLPDGRLFEAGTQPGLDQPGPTHSPPERP